MPRAMPMRPLTGVQAKRETPACASIGAAPGSTLRGSSAQRLVRGTPPTTGTSLWGSAWLGRSHEARAYVPIWTMTNQATQLLSMTASTAGRSYTLSYFDRPGSGLTILYVHGLGCSKADFIDMTFVPELKPFQLISADNPGCGDTFRPRQFAGTVSEPPDSKVFSVRLREPQPLVLTTTA